MLDTRNLFYILDTDKQEHIHMKYAAARLYCTNKVQDYQIGPYQMAIIDTLEDIFGKDVLEENNPYMTFVVE